MKDEPGIEVERRGEIGEKGGNGEQLKGRDGKTRENGDAESAERKT